MFGDLVTYCVGWMLHRLLNHFCYLKEKRSNVIFTISLVIEKGRQFVFRQFLFRQFIFRHRSIYSSDVRGFEEGWPLPPFPSVRSSLHSPPSFLSPSPLSLTSRPPYCGYGIWGSALAPPVGPGGVRPPNGIWWISRFKNDVNTRVQAYIFLTESHTLSSKTSLHATLQYKCTVF